MADQGEREIMDLKESMKERLFRDMIRAVQPQNGLKVMVVDQESMRIISSACRMYDIMEEGVTLVEKIDIQRQPIPNLEAIYFITPTDASVELMCNDFKTLSQPQYAAAHIFFTTHAKEEILDKIKSSNIVRRIKALKEINVNFVAYEQQAFHFDSPETFHTFYCPKPVDLRAEKSRMADKLVSVCVTLKEYPVVRYHNTSGAQSFAALVQDKLDRLMRTSSEFAGSANTGNRAQLLILDRCVDPIAPVLHEFTYQAMIYDVLKLEHDHYKYKVTTNEGAVKEKEVVMGENDPLWSTVRHMHIADLMNWLLDSFNDFLKENKATKLASKGGSVSSLKEMSESMKAMPQFQEMLNKYSLHINMAEAAMREFNERGLERFAMIEQALATGEDSEGNPPKNMVANLSVVLNDEHVDMYEKVRLLMIYIISQEGVKDTDRRRFVDAMKMKASETAVLTNLRYLGVSLVKTGRSKKDVKKDKKKRRADAPSYELSRYVPVVKSLGEDWIAGKLSTSDFPFAKEDTSSGKQPQASSATTGAVSLRKSAQPRFFDKGGKKEEKKKGSSFSGPRFIIFVVGGVTYSELRSAYELSAKFGNQFIIGSTHIITPKSYCDAVRDLATTDEMLNV